MPHDVPHQRNATPVIDVVDEKKTAAPVVEAREVEAKQATAESKKELPKGEKEPPNAGFAPTRAPLASLAGIAAPVIANLGGGLKSR
ncbi:uncharacterized protein EV422DRAFT_565332 [Fimicolochytrium jonesii]|uniref:uncharacterized protein n=1 Tax=Fimicolochytrium jonesii TaxID=1396493 RepID=UPI0022FEC903|nr:uncharacterized protein EV422DRAFT_565332 [Fimicolochytrium jonesii]KAI8823382.1 hypothetical protein EV422DRAFT_565332 [Fimicolochytrium jonesii]